MGTHESTEQRLAAEGDATFIKLITDLHAYCENPLPLEEVLKRCKEKGQESTQATSQSDVAPGVTSIT